MTPKAPPFLMWYDDNPKTPIADRLAAAIRAYTVRFGRPPTLALVNPAETVPAIDGLRVARVATVRLNTYWVGWETTP